MYTIGITSIFHRVCGKSFSHKGMDCIAFIEHTLHTVFLVDFFFPR